MGHVQVAAQNDRLLFVERCEVFAQRVFKRHAVVNSLQFFLRVRRIHRNKIEVVQLCRDHPSLVVKLRLLQTINKLQRLPFQEERSAGIPLLFRAVPELMVALERYICLMRLHLCFLQRQNIRRLLLHKGNKSLAHAGAQPVYIPRNHFHTLIIRHRKPLDKQHFS